MIPEYQISNKRVVPEQILDVIPEQEKSDNAIQASEERYLQSIQQNNIDEARNTEKTWGQIAGLSTTLGNYLQKKQEKHRQDREAEISLEILTRGVSPELEAQFKGERDKLFEDDLATQEFASKYESETGDSITANEFRKMAGWEKYMVAEQYALEKAKDYDKYVYDAYETTKIDVVRDGKEVSVGHLDNLSAAEHAALDAKIKFEYAKNFAGLNEALVATVVKPEIDKFDENRRKKQAVKREENYQAQVKASDSRMIAVGFVTANPADGHQLAHDWAARYAARNNTTISAGRTAFKENLVDLVSQNVITYPQAISIVNHEITARDGSTKTMSSWKEWSGIEGELVDAAELGSKAREERKEANIAADLQVIRENDNLSNDAKAQLMTYYKDKYDGYVPTEISDALRGHLDDNVAEDMIKNSLRYNGGVYDYEMANVSTEVFNKYKDKIIPSGALNPGTADYKKAQNLIKSYTNQGTNETFGETDIKSVEWITLNGNLEEIFNEAYRDAYIRDGKIVGTPQDAFKAGQLAIKEAVEDNGRRRELMKPDLDPSDDSYSRKIQLNLEQGSGGKWKKRKLDVDLKTQDELVRWSETPLKQAKDVPDYYRDLARRMGVNPVDLANQQLKYINTEKEGEKGEVKGATDGKEETKLEDQYDDKFLELIYKFPTKASIIQAKIIDASQQTKPRDTLEGSYPGTPEIPEGLHTGHKKDETILEKIGIPTDTRHEKRDSSTDKLNWNIKTSPFNKKALMREDM